MIRLLVLGLLLLASLLALIVFKPRHQLPAKTPSIDTGAEPAGLTVRPIHLMRSEEINNGRRYFVRNLLAGAIEADCRILTAHNVQSDPSLPRRIVLGALDEAEVSSVRSADTTQDSGASVSCAAIVGDPRALIDAGAVYALPFHSGTAYRLDQGYNGSFSHHDPESRYALDFGVAIGTPIFAARAGVVMQIEDQFRGHGLDPERFGDRANYVRIVHDDGSMAVYAHLAPDTVLVAQGDTVRAGDLLGKSGDTGFSSGPHLHFAVQKNVGMALQSIPFSMTGVDPYQLH